MKAARGFAPDEAIGQRVATGHPGPLFEATSGGILLPEVATPEMDEPLWDEAGPGRVQTPEFRAWFGDSKVVDRQGRPLVVYHGTVADFSVFESGHENGWSIPRTGHYFTDDLVMAEEFGRVRSFYLSIKRPADFALVTPGSYAKGWSEGILAEILEHMGDRERQPYIGKSPYRCACGGLLQTETFLEAAQKAGFDGLILDDQLGGGRGFTSFVAFDPRQIKSVDNGGAFDPENPDVMS